jgi:hypothetical protein
MPQGEGNPQNKNVPDFTHHKAWGQKNIIVSFKCYGDSTFFFIFFPILWFCSSGDQSSNKEEYLAKFGNIPKNES